MFTHPTQVRPRESSTHLPPSTLTQQAQVAEVAAVSAHFAAPAGLAATGVTVAGIKYMFVRGEENMEIYVKKVGTALPRLLPSHRFPFPAQTAARATLETRLPPAPLLTGRDGCVLLPLQHLHHRGLPRRQDPAGLVLDDGGQARRLPQGVGHLSPPAPLPPVEHM